MANTQTVHYLDNDLVTFDGTAYDWGDDPPADFAEMYDSPNHGAYLAKLSPWVRWRHAHDGWNNGENQAPETLDDLEADRGGVARDVLQAVVYDPKWHEQIPARAVGQRVAYALDRLVACLRVDGGADRPWIASDRVEEAAKWGKVIDVAVKTVIDDGWTKPAYEYGDDWDATITDYDRELLNIAQIMQTGDAKDIDWLLDHGYLQRTPEEYDALDPYHKWRVPLPVVLDNETGYRAPDSQQRPWPENDPRLQSDWPYLWTALTKHYYERKRLAEYESQEVDIVTEKYDIRSDVWVNNTDAELANLKNQMRLETEQAKARAAERAAADSATQIGYAMCGGIDRLYACLVLAEHPDAPQYERVPISENLPPKIMFKSAADARKFVALAQVVADAVVNEHWLDPEDWQEDITTDFDKRLPSLLADMATKPDSAFDHVTVGGEVLVAPEIDQYVTENLPRWHRIVLLPHLEIAAAEDPENPDEEITIGDLVMANLVQGHRDWLEDSGLGFIEHDQKPDAWKALTATQAGWILDSARLDYSYLLNDERNFSLTHAKEMITGELGEVLNDKELADWFDRAWFSTAGTGVDGNLMPWWPQVVKCIVHTDLDPDDTYFGWHFANAEEARKALIMLREVIKHVYLLHIVDETLPNPTVQQLRNWNRGLDLLRGIESWPDERVLDSVGPSYAGVNEGELGPRDENGRPLVGSYHITETEFIRKFQPRQPSPTKMISDAA